jgi:beta-fructofuranosidase
MDSGVEYLVGSFDVHSFSFSPEYIGILDKGYAGLSGFYATNTLVDPQGRCILFGWIRGFTSGRGWNGCLALPRVLSIGEDGHLRQHPVPELQKLRTRHWSFSQIELHNANQKLDNVQGKQLEILAQFELQDAKRLGLNVRCGDDGSDGIPIAYDGLDLEVDGVKFRFTLAEDETKLTLHIFLDRSVMEVFVNDGCACATRVIYPPEKNLGVEIFSQAGKTTLSKLDIWEMKSIW